MSTTDTLTDVIPSATPSDAEIAAWHALPRDEQLRRLRAAVTHPDATTVSSGGMADVWDKIKARRHQQLIAD
jgi:hypothetical protein